MTIEGGIDIEKTKKLYEANYKRTLSLFGTDSNFDIEPARIKISIKINDEYPGNKAIAETKKYINTDDKATPLMITQGQQENAIKSVIKSISKTSMIVSNKEKELTNNSQALSVLKSNLGLPDTSDSYIGSALSKRRQFQASKPVWHPPWKLMKVISGHLGWVRSVTVEPGNKWFATGSADRTIKIWDLASGILKLTLTGHISTVRGLGVSIRSPYLFSAGEDKSIKCWDLEMNKVIRSYHGHLSAIYGLSLHPVLDLLVTSGRDATARIWDIRTKQAVHVLSGHKSAVCDVLCQEANPQVITSSMDSTVRFWDIIAGKTSAVLTHHKKAVRSIAAHPNQFSIVSGSSDNIKLFNLPDGTFVRNLEGHNSIVNSLSVNADNVVVSGADNGSLKFWDWNSGYSFQSMDSIVQPGSLDSEAGIFCSTFDKSGLRFITGEADKSIKIWKEDENASEETHPLDWKPSLSRRKF